MPMGSTESEYASGQYGVRVRLHAVQCQCTPLSCTESRVRLWAVQSQSTPLGSKESEYSSEQYGV
jgi:hypothetical protein